MRDLPLEHQKALAEFALAQGITGRSAIYAALSVAIESGVLKNAENNAFESNENLTFATPVNLHSKH